MASEGGTEFKSHSEILQHFVSMRKSVDGLWSKINELQNEVSEHEQVLKALDRMDHGRRCYRLIGDVLVERTVGEIIPDIQQNERGLQTVLSKLREQLEKERTALAAFQNKYKIRVKGESDGADAGEDEPKQGGGAASSTQGVLVSTS